MFSWLFQSKEEKEKRLLKAAKAGDLTTVRRLVETKSVNVEAKNDDGRTPLSWAAYNGHIDTVRCLVEKANANVEAKNNYEYTPLILAANNGHIDTVRYLVEKANANVEAKNNIESTPLILAARNGHIDTVRYLVEKANANVEAKNDYGWTPLSMAAYRGHIDVVRYLVEKVNANVEAKSSDGRTALDLAVLFRQKDVAEYLSKHAAIGSKKEDQESGESKETKTNEEDDKKKDEQRLLKAAEAGDLTTLRRLVETKSVNVEAKNDDGSTPLMLAAYNGRIDTVRYLVEKANANVEAKDNHGYTSVLLAACDGHIDAVRYLVEKAKANVETKNMFGNTALDLAVQNKKKSVVEYLTKKAFTSPFPLSVAALKQLFSSTTPWRRSRVMIVGKGHTGKTTLYMALKGEEFRVIESTVVADVTVQDVSAVTITDEKQGGKNITETVFKNVSIGGNHERALATAYLEKKKGKDKRKSPRRGEKSDKREAERVGEKNTSSTIPNDAMAADETKEVAHSPQIVPENDPSSVDSKEKREKTRKEDEMKNNTIVSTAAVTTDKVRETVEKTTVSLERKKDKSAATAMVKMERDHSSVDPDSDVKEVIKSKDFQRSDVNEEQLLKELDPGRLQESLDNPDAMRVSVWDFAGQEVFYTSHVMFLNRNCLYMVVFSLEEFLGREREYNGNTAERQKKKSVEYLRFWLQNIRTFAPGAPFVFVGTKIDKLREKDQPEALLNVLNVVDREITEIAREVFKGFKPFPWSRCKRWCPKGGALQQPANLVFFPADSKFRTDNGDVHSTIKELRNEVMEKLKTDEKANEEVPSAWTKVCDDLIAKNQPIFTFNAVKVECRRHGIVEEKEVRWMLLKYHELGLAIYFDELELRDHVVMQPQHLIDLVKKLIYDRGLHDSLYKNQELAAEYADELNQFFYRGVIHEEVLKHIWQTPWPKDNGKEDKKTRESHDSKERKRLYEFCRGILQKFMILCKIGETGKYLVPSMMQFKEGNMEQKHAAVGKFSLYFKCIRPHSYFEMLVGSTVTEFSSNSERTRELRRGATGPMILKEQKFAKGEVELYIEPLRFRMSTSMLRKDEGGWKSYVMAINVEILSEYEDGARLLRFILYIANKINKWPYKQNDAAAFSVLLFDREMIYAVEYEKWQEACEEKKRKIVSKIVFKSLEVARFRAWEPFYELFLENPTLRYTFGLLGERSSGESSNPRKKFIALSTMKQILKRLYPSENDKSFSKRMANLSPSAAEDGKINVEQYIDLIWIERGSQLRKATNASDFDAKLEAWIQPLTSIISESRQMQQQITVRDGDGLFNNAIAKFMMTELLTENGDSTENKEDGKRSKLRAMFFSPDEVKKIRNLGEGRYGMVSKVQITVDGRNTVAAMKRTKESFSEDLLSELFILSNLKPHPNLLRFYGIVTENQPPFLTEFCEEGSLDRLHGDMNLTTKDRFWQIVKGVLSGLDAFHRAGMIHRDIACRNLFMKTNGTVVLGDYGVSIQAKGNVITDGKTELAWAWLAPESLLNSQFSQKSDVWMFGVTAWEILTKGRQPHVFLGSDEDFVSQLLRGRMPLKIPEDSNVPSRADSLLNMCFKYSIKENSMAGRMIFDIAERPTASDLLLHVEQWSKEDDPLATPEPFQRKKDDSKSEIRPQEESVRNNNTKSWSKHDIARFIRTISTEGNMKWKKCIEVVLEEDLDYTVLEDCKVDDLEKLGMPKFHARSLLRKLKEVSESMHSKPTEEKSMAGRVITDINERSSASDPLHVEQGSKEDDPPVASQPVKQTEQGREKDDFKSEIQPQEGEQDEIVCEDMDLSNDMINDITASKF